LCRAKEDLQGVNSARIILANGHDLFVLGTMDPKEFHGPFCDKIPVDQSRAKMAMKGNALFQVFWQLMVNA
jgi:hypothetical protein